MHVWDKVCKSDCVKGDLKCPKRCPSIEDIDKTRTKFEKNQNYENITKMIPFCGEMWWFNYFRKEKEKNKYKLKKLQFDE